MCDKSVLVVVISKCSKKAKSYIGEKMELIMLYRAKYIWFGELNTKPEAINDK